VRDIGGYFLASIRCCCFVASSFFLNFFDTETTNQTIPTTLSVFLVFKKIDDHTTLYDSIDAIVCFMSRIFRISGRRSKKKKRCLIS